LAKTGESQVFCEQAMLDLPVPDENVDFDADLSPIIEAWTTSYAATEEMHDEARFNALPDADKVTARGIEVGHIFYFGTKYSEAMNANVTGPDGKDVPVHMGSYGIGPSRLVAALIEASHDENGIIWPDAIAPFKVGIINLKQGDEATDAACEKIYKTLTKSGVTVLYDDTNERAGGKFASMDLIGVPQQIIVGPRGLANNEVELKNRATGEKQTVSLDAAINQFIVAA
jgi:prolyl-tRNA synthetase